MPTIAALLRRPPSKRPPTEALSKPLGNPERHVVLLRLAVWTVVFLLVVAAFRGHTPWVWRMPALAALFTCFSLFLERGQRRPTVVWTIDLGVDLVCTLVLTLLTGRFGSPFVPLYFLWLAEAVALFGRAGAAAMAVLIALFGMANLRSLRDPHETVSYGAFAVGGLASGWLLRRTGLRDVEDRDTLMKVRTIEDVERQVEALEEQNRQIRASYREMAAAARDQKARLEQHNLAQRIFMLSATTAGAQDILRSVIDELLIAFEAQGGVLWQRNEEGDALEVRATAGRVAPIVWQARVELNADSVPSSVRKACEEHLSLAAPVVSPDPVTSEDESAPPGDVLDAPDDGALLLSSTLRDGDDIVGVIGLCAAKAGRFGRGEMTRLSSLSPALSLVCKNVDIRGRLSREVRERTMQYDMVRLAQTAMDIDELSARVLERVVAAVPCDGATLYAFDPGEQRLMPRSTFGRAVNLIDHIPFEHGHGVSGWVASQRKQMFVPDILREPGLLHAELIPPAIRSFISVPMHLDEEVVGVINVNHSRPNAFTLDDAKVLALLADQAAYTLETGETLRSLEILATTDEVSGLLNARFFRHRVSEEVQRATRYQLPVSLMLLFVDGYADMVARLGNEAGQTVLQRAADALRANVRETEVVSRLDDELFGVLLPQTTVADAAIAAERIRARIDRDLTTATSGFQGTVCIGIADYPDRAGTAEALFGAADTALRTAIQSGGGQIRAAGEALSSTS